MRKALARFLCAIMVLSISIGLIPVSQAAMDYSWIRVKLSVANATSLALGISGSYFINENGASFSGGVLSIRVNSNGTLTATHSSAGEVYTGASFSLMRENVDRTAGSVAIGSRYYLGHFKIKATASGYIQVVNQVPLAQYLYGVVGYEMSNTFPLEALRAQAIAAKCYVLTGLSPNSEYDIGDTSADQVYKGYDASAANVIQAVDSTLNLFLTVNGGMLRTYYAASNGGETKLLTQAWSDRGSDAGYGIAIDEFDFANQYSPKETLFFPINGGTIPPALGTFLAGKASLALGVPVASVDSIQYVEANTPRYLNVTRDMTKATVMMTVTTADVSGLGVLGGETATPAMQTQATVTFNLSELLSGGLFTSTSLRTYWGAPVIGGYAIYHVRYGHGVGMSQRGAQQRASAGHSFSQILAFYYPGATISTVAITPPTNPVKPAPTPGSSTMTFPAVGVTTGSVNFRSGPSTAYDKIKLLSKGEQVILYSYENGWYSVYCSGSTGYLSADYVKWVRAAEASDLPATNPQTSPTPTPSGSGGTAATGLGEVTGSGVAFRSGPATSYTIYTRLSKGTALTLYDKTGTWYQAMANGQVGFISESYVKVLSSGTTPEPTPGTTPEPTTPDTSELFIGVVTASGVNFRDKPNPSTSASIAKLSKDTQLIVWGLKDKWYSARYGLTEGYIHSDYIRITGKYTGTQPTNPSTPSTILGTGQTTGSVNFREGPATSYKKITQLAAGTTLTLYALENGWYEAQAGSTHGYVSAKYVKIVQSSQQTQQSAAGRTTGTVNLRNAPSTTSGAILNKLSSGVDVTILGQTAEWYLVSCNGVTGYLYKAYVKVVSAGSSGIPTIGEQSATPTPSPTPAPTGLGVGTAAITTGEVYLREAPSTLGTVIRTLAAGTPVTIYNAVSGWYLVSVDGTLGYVNASYLKAA
ncbi:MAG: SH3 domain-containing protein [Bacillota bacterium]